MIMWDPGLSADKLRKLPLNKLVEVIDERYGELMAQLDDLPRLGSAPMNTSQAIWELQSALQVLRDRIKNGEEVKENED